MTAPLFITADEALQDELLRLAAAAGITPELAVGAAAGLRSWVGAPLVVVGQDLAPALARLAPARRDDVLLVCWGGPDRDDFRHALELGAGQLLELSDQHDVLVRTLAELVDPRAVSGVTVGVVAGCGGAGASTFACALGQVAGGTGPAVVVDADPVGPGLDRLLGLDDRPGIRWSDLLGTSGRLGSRALREAVPSREGVGVLTWSPGQAEPPSLPVARETLAAARRGHDTVVVDLARGGGPLTDELIPRVDVLLVVTTATVMAVASTVRWCARSPHPRKLLVVRGAGVGVDEIASVTGVPAVCSMASQRRLDEAVDLGLGPARPGRGPLRRAAGEVLDRCAGPVTLW